MEPSKITHYRQHASILLVDDEEEILLALQETLILNKTFAESDIHRARNGAEGLAHFKDLRPDIVLTDLNMPKMNGFDMIDGIRGTGSSAEIVVMTGYADLESTVTLFKRNVSDFVQKPFDFAVVAGVLAKIRDRVIMRHQNDFLKSRLAETEKLSSVGLLAAGVAHEVNNPNTFIKGNTEIIKRYAAPYLTMSPKDVNPEKVIDAMKEIAISADSVLHGSERISKISSSLLHYTRNTKGQKESLSIVDILKDAQDLSKYRLKKHQLSIKVPPDAHRISANFTEMVQVILNLFINAIDAIEERFSDESSEGMLSIIVSDEPATQTQLIQISDNGPGIPDELSGKIFDPFFTTKPVGKGSGLGLSICRGIIDSHGGKLTFASRKNEGTTFHIRLPWA